MLIPIGSWCRTAYQVNEFIKARGGDATSFPFDWTITPYSSLKIIFDGKFNPSDVLNIENLELNKVGSITDNGTQLIHHHDFPPAKMKELGQKGGFDERGIPNLLYASGLIDKASGRFDHTYRHMESLKNSSNKLSFVRWCRLGHPDQQFPHVFEGESIANLTDIISSYLSHDNFSILTVKTQLTDGLLPEEVITEYERNEYGVSSTIVERKGFDGDGTNNFKGDTVVWHRLLNKFVEDEGLILDSNQVNKGRKEFRSLLGMLFSGGKVRR